MSDIHASVLLDEVMDALSPHTDGVYLDCTCGLGGHTQALAERSAPGGRVLSVDRDPKALALAQGRLGRFKDRVTLVEGHFSDVSDYAGASDHLPLDGVVADLGVSSLQLDDAGRGFSFMRSGPLDMRMGPTVGPTAAELLEAFDAKQLGKILREFGEVARPRQVAEAVVTARDAGQLTSTKALADVIERASGGRRASPIHPATRAFQAIRIAVNRELEELSGLLRALVDLVRPGGRVAIISFHSLEDRLVKRAFTPPPPEPQPAKLPVEPVRPYAPWRPLTKKPVVPSAEEVERNPRSRSAKLRVAERNPPEAR
ncbi:MAG: 16S rRNA (cytosine(1402)-N(4))-methyltransferase RsmH [Myxococcota bacterium]